jgi:hypothetical protein
VLHWHQEHALTSQRSHARREVYDVLWLLAQVLERTKKEPKRARSWTPELETVLIRSHRLISHLAGIKGLLTVRQAELDPGLIQPALHATEQTLKSVLTLQVLPADTSTSEPTVDVIHDLPATHAEPGPWLLHRLDQTASEACALAQAARAIIRPQAQ